MKKILLFGILSTVAFSALAAKDFETDYVAFINYANQPYEAVAKTISTIVDDPAVKPDGKQTKPEELDTAFTNEPLAIAWVVNSGQVNCYPSIPALPNNGTLYVASLSADAKSCNVSVVPPGQGKQKR